MWIVFIDKKFIELLCNQIYHGCAANTTFKYIKIYNCDALIF